MPMTPSRAYLLRALNDWIIDNQCTPYIVVDASVEGVDVPKQHIKNGQIVLNINPAAIRMLEISNESVVFEARFGGKSCSVYIPMEAVTAVYAKENGQGMVFGWEPEPTGPESPGNSQNSSPPQGKVKPRKPAATAKPNLKVVK